jgi:hypoxanthine phosphoribosyltransferase
MKHKVYLTWEQVDTLVTILKHKVLDKLPEIDSVTGIARGGLIPAVMLSHKLGVPYTQSVGPNTLVVDDICDSGVTLKDAPGVYTATLHYKSSAISKPNVYASLLLNESQWISYPWETDEADMLQGYLE